MNHSKNIKNPLEQKPMKTWMAIGCYGLLLVGKKKVQHLQHFFTTLI